MAAVTNGAIERTNLLADQKLSKRESQSQLKRKKYMTRFVKCFFIGQWPVLHIIGMTLTANFFINFLTEATDNAYNNTVTYKITIMLRVANGAVLLLYPFMGWLAEAYITYYRSIGGGLYLILVSMSIALGLSTSGLFIDSINKQDWYWVLAIIALTTSFLGNGVFSANAIQLGTDQMLEASSDQLSSFVHWYYWATQTGGPVIYCIIIVIGEVGHWHGFTLSSDYLAVVLSLLQIILAVIGIIIFHAAKKYLYIQPTRKNTIKTIYNVLQYARRHKYPQRRSAMTYWEDFSPSRVDLGKEKYGGPFTAEEVESTKSFLRILLLLVSLFGLYTVDTTTALTEAIVHNTSSHNITTSMKLFVVHNTDFITQLTLLVMIPLHQLAFKPLLNNYMPSMVKRFWMGLVCAFLSSVSALFIKMIVDGQQSNDSVCSLFTNKEYDVNIILALLAVPQVLLGLAKLLVFLTGLEFILAQAPREVQGLLIGLWYMMGIVKQANDSIDDTDIRNNCTVYIVRSCLTFVSLILYSILLYFYKYRRRDDIVDGYGLVANKVASTISRREAARKPKVSEIHISEITLPSNRTSINSDGQGTVDFLHSLSA